MLAKSRGSAVMGLYIRLSTIFVSLFSDLKLAGRVTLLLPPWEGDLLTFIHKQNYRKSWATDLNKVSKSTNYDIERE